MQANRYDRAAEAPIMNTYVPINFGELYRIGQAQRQAVEQAANEFTNTVSKFGEFQSPSAVDTQRYYENSLGKIRDLIDEAATNPDAMKDANFRARLNSRIANLDYATLSNLRQSREGMLARQKANQELMIKVCIILFGMTQISLTITQQIVEYLTILLLLLINLKQTQ